MNYKTIVLVSVLYTTFGFSLNDFNIKNKIIVDITNCYKGPASLLLYTKQNKYSEIDLVKELKRKGNFKTIQDVNNVRWQDLKINAKNIFITADLNSPRIDEFLKDSFVRTLFRSPYRWILFDDDNSDGEAPRPLADLYITTDSEVAYVHKTTSNTYDIKFLYRIGPKGVWRTEYYGTWSLTQGLQRSTNFIEVTALRRRNLHGHLISTVFVAESDDTVNHLTDRKDDLIDSLAKISYPISHHLMDFLNASRNQIYTKTWGAFRNGSWDGMTGYVARGEADIAGLGLFMTTQRFPIIHFITVPSPVRLKFVFMKPQLSYTNNLFLLSFQKELWYGSAALMVLLFLILFVTTIWEWRTKSNDVMQSPENDVLRPNPFDVGLLIVGAICIQGSPVELKGASGRIVLLILFVALTFLYTSFSANIVALLQSSSTQIKTIEDLLHSKLRLGVQNSVYIEHYFKIESDPIRKAVYETKIVPPGEKPHFMSIEDGVKEIQKGRFGFHMETVTGYKLVGKYFTESEKCALQEMKFLRIQEPWTPVFKNTTFLEMYKIGIKRIEERGLQFRANSLFQVRFPKCSGTSASFVSVGMLDCFPAFLVLIYGVLISSLIAVFEYLHHKIKIRQQIKITLSVNKN